MFTKRRPPLKALSVFESAARHGSFARAAEELSLSPAAITYQVRLVEQHYGLTLFQRSGNGVSLTVAGAAFHEKISLALAFIDDATQALAGGRARETLTVAAPISFTLRWLILHLDDFRRRYPDLDLRLRTVGPDRAALLTPPDVEIGFGPSSLPDAALEPLMEETFQPYLPVALEAEGEDDVALLRHCPILHFSRTLVSWRLWLDSAGIQRETRPDDLVFDRAFMAIAAAAQGLGIVLDGDCLVGGDVRSGRLRPLRVPDAPPIRRCRYFIRHPDRAGSGEKFLLFRDWLRHRIEGWRAGAF